MSFGQAHTSPLVSLDGAYATVDYLFEPLMSLFLLLLDAELAMFLPVAGLAVFGAVLNILTATA